MSRWKICIDFGTTNSSVNVYDLQNGTEHAVRVSTGREYSPYVVASERFFMAGEGGSFKRFLDIPVLHKRRQRNLDRYVEYVYDAEGRIVDSWAAPIPEWEETAPDLPSEEEVVAATEELLLHLIDRAREAHQIRWPDLEAVSLATPLSFGATANRRYVSALVGALQRAFAGQQGGLVLDGSMVWAFVRDHVHFEYEPVAVAAGLNPRGIPGDATLLVFDYGGGTLDVAVLEAMITEQSLVPRRQIGLAADGRAGDYLDRALLRHLVETNSAVRRAVTGTTKAEERTVLRNIRKLKEDLSKSESANYILPGMEQNQRLERAALEEAYRPVLDNVLAAVEKKLEGHGVDFSSISHLALVGGSCLIPSVQSLVIQWIRALGAQIGDDCIITFDPRSDEQARRAFSAVSFGLASDRRTTDERLSSKVAFLPLYAWTRASGFVRMMSSGESYGSGVSVSMLLDGRDPATIAVYQGGEGEIPKRYIGGVGGLGSWGPGQVQVTYAPGDSVIPTIEVKGAERRSARLSPLELADGFAVERFVLDGVPLGTLPEKPGCLTRPVAKGDTVHLWAWSEETGGGHAQAVTVVIGEVARLKHGTRPWCDFMEDLVAEDYVFYVRPKRKDGIYPKWHVVICSCDNSLIGFDPD